MTHKNDILTRINQDRAIKILLETYPTNQDLARALLYKQNSRELLELELAIERTKKD